MLFIVLGTGLLKPNVSSMVGELYPEGGARRDAGFSVYYMGINLGAFIAPFICGTLGEKVGWHWGFGAAGVGMVLGLIQYRLTEHHLGDIGLSPAIPEAGSRAAPRHAPQLVDPDHRHDRTGAGRGRHRTGHHSVQSLLVARGTSYIIIGLATLFFAAVYAFGKLDRQEKLHVGGIIMFFLAAAIFWAGFEQAGSTFNLFADRYTDRMILGWEMPASWLQSVNSVFIILLAPAFGALWLRLAAKNLNPSLPLKMALGLIQLGLGFLVMYFAAKAGAGRQPGAAHLAGTDLPAAYHRRALPEPDRHVGRDQAVTQALQWPDDGYLVHGHRAGQPDRRPGRGRVHRQQRRRDAAALHGRRVSVCRRRHAHDYPPQAIEETDGQCDSRRAVFRAWRVRRRQGRTAAAEHASSRMSRWLAELRIARRNPQTGTWIMTRLVSLLLCTLSLACLALPARADTIWVGNTSSDTACDAGSLANAMLIAAFNGTPSDTIRISNEGGGTSGSYLDTNTVLEGNDILVQGGYADCSGTPGSNAVLDGTGSPAAPVVKITCSSSGCATRHTFTLRNLVLKNGEAGGVDVSGNVQVNLDGVTLIQNSNINGGALHVDASQNAVVNLYGLSTLRNSSASASGGGIYCSGFPSGGSAFQVFMTDALIYQNDAVDGGGVYLTNSCRMRAQLRARLTLSM